jgi:hypothetical protein
MELRYRGVLYNFEYDYAPNCEEAPMAVHVTRSGRGIEGSVHVTDIYRNGRFDRQSPVSTEVLELMIDAAAEDVIARGCPVLSDSLLRQLRPRRPRRSRAAGSRL